MEFYASCSLYRNNQYNQQVKYGNRWDQTVHIRKYILFIQENHRMKKMLEWTRLNNQTTFNKRKIACENCDWMCNYIGQNIRELFSYAIVFHICIGHLEHSALVKIIAIFICTYRRVHALCASPITSKVCVVWIDFW